MAVADQHGPGCIVISRRRVRAAESVIRACVPVSAVCTTYPLNRSVKMCIGSRKPNVPEMRLRAEFARLTKVLGDTGRQVRAGMNTAG
jgi:hypothetical protein